MRLGVFGGTFNPIHYGHLRAAEEVRELCGLDRVLFVPSGNPPLKDANLTAAGHRYAMTAAATASNRCFAASDVELSLPGKSYTVNTVGVLRSLYPGDEILLVLGMDAFLEIPLWWRPDDLVAMADFIVVSRPGHGTSGISGSPYVRGAASAALPGPETGSDPGTGPYEGSSFVLTSGRRATVVPVTPLDISSTRIREMVGAGRSITYLVPPEVEAYILAAGLYRD